MSELFEIDDFVFRVVDPDNLNADSMYFVVKDISHNEFIKKVKNNLKKNRQD